MTVYAVSVSQITNLITFVLGFYATDKIMFGASPTQMMA